MTKAKYSFTEFSSKSLLWADSFPVWAQYLFLFISNLQCLGISFSNRFEFLQASGSGTLVQSIKEISDLITLHNIFNSAGNQVLIFGLVILTFTYFMMIFLTFIYSVVCFFVKKTISTNAILFINILSQIHLSFGFWFTTIILIEATNYNNSHLILIPQTSTNLTLMNIVFFLLIAFNFCFGALLSVFSYNPVFNYRGLSAHSVNFQFLTFLTKLALSVIIFIDRLILATTPWLFLVAFLILMILRHIDLIRFFPYYEYTAMKISMFLSSFCLLNGVTNFIAYCLQNALTISVAEVCFVDLFMIPFVVIYCHNYFHNILLPHLSLNNQRIKSEEAALKKLFCLRYLLKNAKLTSNTEQSADLAELHFLGFFSFQQEKGQVSVPPNTSKKSLKQTKITKKSSSLVGKTKIIDLIQDCIKITKNSEKLRIILICLFMENLENLATSTFYLGTLSKSRGLLKAVCLKLHDKLQQNLDNQFAESSQKTLSIRDYINLDIISTEFIKLIHSNSQKYVDFWKNFSNPKVEIKGLYSRSIEIEKEHDLIQKFWAKRIETNSIFCQSLNVIYSIYTSIVRNSPASAQRILEKYRIFGYQKTELKEKDDEITAETINNPTNLMLQASMSKEKLGRIIYASTSIVDTLGWQKQNLEGQNLNVILPSFLQERHNKLLLEHLEQIMRGENINRNTKVQTFIKDKMNNVLSCQVYLSLHPFIQTELTYVSLIKLKNLKENLIILNKRGFIEGFSRSIGSQLHLIAERRTHIREICNNYSELEVHFERNYRALNQRDDEPGNTLNLYGKKENFFSEDELENFKAGSFLQFYKLSPSQQEQHKRIREYKAEISFQKAGDLSFIVLSLTETFYRSNQEDLKLSEIFLKNDENDLCIPEERMFSDTPILSRVCSQGYASHAKFTERTQLLDIFPQSKSGERKKLFKVSHSTREFEQVSGSVPSVPSKLFAHGQEIRNKHTIRNIFQNVDTYDTSSVSDAQKFNSQIEEAAKMVPRDAKMKILVVLLIIYLFTPLITSTLFQLKNTQTLDKIEDNVDILSKSTFRLAKIADLYRASKYIILTDLGLMHPMRYSSFFGQNVDIKASMAIAMKPYADQLNMLNNQIRDSVYKIEANLHETLYDDLLPVFEPGDRQKSQFSRLVNQFDLVTELIATAYKIIKTPISQMNLKNRDIVFMLDNSLNDAMVSGEKISPILLEDSNIKLEAQQSLIIIFIILKGCFILIILIILYKIIKDFIEKRDQFIDILVYLGKDNIGNEVHIVEKFVNFLEKNNMDFKRINLKMEPEQFMSKNVNPMSENTKIKRKTVDPRGKNSTLNKLIFSIFLFILLVFSINIVLLFIAASQKKTVSSKINIMAESSFILYKIKLFRSIIFEYIQANEKTTVRNKPIQEEWDYLFSELTKAQDFFIINLLNEEYGIGDDPEIVQVVRGSLCDIIKIESLAMKSTCKILAAGALEKGLVGLNSYMLSALSNLKTTFDSSQKGFYDRFKAINSAEMVIIDAMEYYFSYQAFDLIDSLTRSRINKDLNGFKNSLKTITIIYVTISLAIGIIAWKKITKNLEEEFASWRKMLRLIPYGILIHNKLIRNYLVKNSNGILSKLH